MARRRGIGSLLTYYNDRGHGTATRAAAVFRSAGRAGSGRRLGRSRRSAPIGPAEPDDSGPPRRDRDAADPEERPARMTAVGMAVRWFHLAASLLLIGIFSASLLAGRSDRVTALRWEARLLWWMRRLVPLVLLREREHSTADWAAFRLEGWLLGAAAAAAAAWAGHAAAVQSSAPLPALIDALHLLAAGVWLGALIPLAALLRSASIEAGADARPYAVLAIRRFS